MKNILLLLLLFISLVGCNLLPASSDESMEPVSEELYEEDYDYEEEDLYIEDYDEASPTDVDEYGVYAHDSSDDVERLLGFFSAENYQGGLDYIDEYVDYDDPDIDALERSLHIHVSIESIDSDTTMDEKATIKEEAYQLLENLDFAVLSEPVLIHMDFLLNELGERGDIYKPGSKLKELTVVTDALNYMSSENYEMALLIMDEHVEKEGKFVSEYTETYKFVYLLCEIGQYDLSKQDVLDSLKDIDPEYEHDPSVLPDIVMRKHIDMLNDVYGITHQDWLHLFYD